MLGHEGIKMWLEWWEGAVADWNETRKKAMPRASEEKNTEKAPGLKSDWLKVFKCWVFGLKSNLLHKHFIIAVSPQSVQTLSNVPWEDPCCSPPLLLLLPAACLHEAKCCRMTASMLVRRRGGLAVSHLTPACHMVMPLNPPATLLLRPHPPTASTAGHASRPAGGFLQHAGP